MARIESQTILKAKSGDPEALTELVNRHKELAFNVALRITNNNEDAEDIIQDSFLKVLKNVNRFKEESNFSTWLFRIVYNQAVMLMRKRKRSLEFLNAPCLEQIHEEEKCDRFDNYQKLYEAIDKLSVNERNLIDLFYLGGMSVKDIRNITGKSTSNIKVILHRARLKMQQTLKDE